MSSSHNFMALNRGQCFWDNRVWKEGDTEKTLTSSSFHSEKSILKEGRENCWLTPLL